MMPSLGRFSFTAQDGPPPTHSHAAEQAMLGISHNVGVKPEAEAGEPAHKEGAPGPHRGFPEPAGQCLYQHPEVTLVTSKSVRKELLVL